MQKVDVELAYFDRYVEETAETARKSKTTEP